MHLLSLLVYLAHVPVAALILARLYCIFKKRAVRQRAPGKAAQILGFFHPSCAGGGGGERVLWIAVKTLLSSVPASSLHMLIYTHHEDANREQLFQRVKDCFNIDIPMDAALTLVPIRTRTLLEPKWYPLCTMFGQSLGALVVALECFIRCPCDVWCDTTGWAYTFPVAALLGARVMAYVHYPTISTDMLQRVRERRPQYNNRTQIAQHATASSLKLWYYKVYAFTYAVAGSFASLVMVNSSWTRAHIENLWSTPQQRIVTVYPPCDTVVFERLPAGNRQKVILSVGQFRSEKDHMLQLTSFHRYLQSHGNRGVKLVMLGGARGSSSQQLLNELKQKAADLGIQASVEFIINADFKTLLHHLQTAGIGIHTMWNEHFGISVVEMMAAGLITIAHGSGGPLSDIVKPFGGVRTGFVATTEEEYAAAIASAVEMLNTDAHAQMTQAAREHVQQFSDEKFSDRFLAEITSNMRLQHRETD